MKNRANQYRSARPLHDPLVDSVRLRDECRLFVREGDDVGRRPKRPAEQMTLVEGGEESQAAETGLDVEMEKWD